MSEQTLCPQCKNDMMMDHIEEKYNETFLFYACQNPQCPRYHIATTATGIEGEAQIQESK